MKCDTCINNLNPNYEINEEHCGKYHWFGLGDPNTIAPEGLWDDCKDYEEEE